ncbi:RagB/SusD family nutrient uptake outer membrane protein [Dyadobacter sediminis]|uniref:RagB/SusD family nutrient uptake outer membrane protein n=1 Tax=Dyadobacter sediminis TaxID=1493691 RepID=A0A5R9KJ56_9BACT|nr:RagB/SusD family nutrient uptake outer membrane protein [Dyadobacter sediminis]TLU96222.1 RagB/SusD family nutrient uptake outer membrane protein [Dyadobacter sediminis]GGB80335.1 membrane protein [Dyadobacter sediminis]
MKKTKYIASCLLVFALAGCQEEFLTVVPETALSSATFFKNEADFQQAVNGIYVPLRQMFNERAWVLEEMHSDNTYYARNTLYGAVDPTENVADFAVPTAGGVTANDNVLVQYRLNYQIIARANQVITSIDDIEFAEESKNNLRGQALFLRAFAYFDLVRLFGKVPLHLTPVAGREDAALPLSGTEEIYAQIEKDAQAASTMLRNKAKQEAGRATSGAAKTLLANLYLTQKKWAQVETLVKDVIANDGYSLMPDYANAFSTTTANKNNQESIFEIQYMEGSAGYNGNQIYRFLPSPITAAEIAPITGTANPQPTSQESNNIPTPDLIAAYEVGDKRKDASIGYVTLSQALTENKTFPYIKKYAKTHAQHNNTGQNWPVYRYAEVLLFAAEAMNEQGKTTEAATYLNQVRKRAGLAATTATSQVAMREAIFKERRVELAFENKRWFDLTRTGRVKEIIGAYGAKVKANPAAYYFPKGAVPPPNAFTVLDDYYGLPAVEAALTPHF